MTEIRPIDANALKGCAIVRPHNSDETAMIRKFSDLVNHFEIPTLDVVQVTRCEECRNAHKTSEKGVYFCDVFECEFDKDFFCKEGKRDVRCKDCRYWQSDRERCNYLTYIKIFCTEDDFCSNAERKENKA